MIEYHNYCFKGFVAELMPFQCRSMAYLQEEVLAIMWLSGGLHEMTWWSPFVPLWTSPYVITGHTDRRDKGGVRVRFWCWSAALAMAGEASRVSLAAASATHAVG